VTDARYRLRVAALIGSAALGLHEARYLIAYGGQSGEQLARQGHAYMSFATALVAGLLALAAVQLMAAVSRARADGSGSATRPPTWKLWLWASAVLLGLYVAQELLEGMLASGHPQGFAGILDEGGWVCAPLALAFGGLVALGLRGADLVVRAAARRTALLRPPRALAARRPRAIHFARTASPLAAKLAGRAPPRLT
jgi:hypothetical protein